MSNNIQIDICNHSFFHMQHVAPQNMENMFMMPSNIGQNTKRYDLICMIFQIIINLPQVFPYSEWARRF